jgi:hypothetical protein
MAGNAGELELNPTPVRHPDPEVAAVQDVVEDGERWPLDRYEEGESPGWLGIVNVWMVVALGFIEVALAFRLGFLLAGANPENGFVQFVMDVTDPLVKPFTGIVADSRLGSAGLFEPSILVAMLVYMIGAVLLMSVIWAIMATTTETRNSNRRRQHSARARRP